MKILSLTIKALTAGYAACFSNQQAPLSKTSQSLSYGHESLQGVHRFNPNPHRHVVEDPKKVDLEYAVHQAKVNEADDLYEFTNIRYGAPPTGELRFQPPQSPREVNRTVNNGDDSRICIQTLTKWMGPAKGFIKDYTNPLVQIKDTEWVIPPVWVSDPPGLPKDPRENEDCLFLDVFVPRPVFDNKETKKVPVLVWIHGGGFLYGYKHQSGSPAGLISRSKGGVVYVAINYRLGAFGWLGGDAYQSEGGIPNLGLHDQRLALAWVQEYIELFGGDPEQVTVMGESAGASSILHHLTMPDIPYFNQAILQSPAFFPQVDSTHLDDVYEKFIKAVGEDVGGLEDLRFRDVSDLIAANDKTAWRSPYGSFTYGPTVGGDLAPDLPGTALRDGNFHSHINVMVGYNADEGLVLTPPYIQTDSALEKHMNTDLFPGAAEGFSSKALELYPLTGNPALYPARSYINRVKTMVADAGILCNAQYLDLAYDNNTWAYKFSVIPGYHGQDVGYTFFPSDPDTPEPIDPRLRPYAPLMARRLQEYITNFAISGDPNKGPSNPPVEFKQYGTGRSMMEFYAQPFFGTQIPIQNARRIHDDVDVAVCQWWQNMPYAVEGY